MSLTVDTDSSLLINYIYMTCHIYKQYLDKYKIEEKYITYMCSCISVIHMSTRQKTNGGGYCIGYEIWIETVIKYLFNVHL